MPSRTVIAFVVLLAGLLPFAVGNADHPPARSRKPVVVTAAALAIHRQALVFDGHNDLPWQFREQDDLSFKSIDLRKPQKRLHTDIARLRKGGVGAQFWSAYVDATQQAVTASRNARADRRHSPHGRDLSRHVRHGLTRPTTSCASARKARSPRSSASRVATRSTTRSASCA